MDAFDLILLAFKGITIASIPLALIWVGRVPHGDGDRLRRLAWVTAFLTFDLVVFGGFTRLTDSGLGCPDWPGCYAKANPIMAASDIRSAEAAMPYGPVTMSKAWIEMIHRYLAMAVGVLIVAMLAISARRAWRARASRRTDARSRVVAEPALAFGLLATVMLQGAFGAWTVTQRLQPIFVSVHLLLGLSLLGLLVLHALKLDERSSDVSIRTGVDANGAASPALLAKVALIVLIAQVALGGWVSANYAVLACSDFPKCQGVWWPPMDFSEGFHPWRALGLNADGGLLSLAALTAIHWVHRSFAAIVVVVLGTLAFRARRLPNLRRPATALVLLLVIQCATGFVNVVYSWPLVAAVLHNATAAGLLCTLVVINYRVADTASISRRRLPIQPFPADVHRPEFEQTAR